MDLPYHWIKIDPPFRSVCFDDGRDYDKPMYVREDERARVYYNKGAEGTPHLFGIVIQEIFKSKTGEEYTDAVDGDCAATLEKAIEVADKLVDYYLKQE